MSYTPPPDAGPSTAATPPPGPPTADMASSPELRAWLEQLQRQDQKLGFQNRALATALALGAAVAVVVLWILYRSTIGGYAALDGIEAVQNPASPGRIDFTLQLARPGQVFYRRSCAGRVTEMVDFFHTTGERNRSWSWSYTPGEEIVVQAWYRSWFLRRRRTWRVATSRKLDVVMLVDTTRSMGDDIQHLKTPCTEFSERVLKQPWQPRYAVVAFGNREADPGLYRHGPTDNVLDFIVAVDQMPRFPDNQALGSALEAIEAALAMPFEEGSTRRFFLVTDNGYHPTTRNGGTATTLAEQLAEQRVRLDVFSLPTWRLDYEILLGTAGRFYPLERFGQMMTQGYVFED